MASLVGRPKVRATAVLVEGERILLVEQRVSETRQWSLPGGTLEPGETLAECVVREVEEETGLQVAVDALLYVCDRIHQDRHVVHITFAVRRIGGMLKLGVEPESQAQPIRSVRMVPISDLSEHGFGPRFCALAADVFPDRGRYAGAVSNIGL